MAVSIEGGVFMSAHVDGKKRPLKQRLVDEFVRYWINVIYLAFFFGVFELYRKLVLAEHGINYVHYGVAIVEALILAKIILIGDAIGLNRGFENKPLIFPTLHKTIVFSLFVCLFSILEHVVEELLHGKNVVGGIAGLWEEGKRNEIFARCLVTFFAFIPFFGFRELARSLGKGKLHRWFFRDERSMHHL